MTFWTRMIAGMALVWSGSATSTVPRAAPELVPIAWLEPVAGGPAGDLPQVRTIPPTDQRVAAAERMIDNEAARFIRTVIAATWRMTPRHRTGALPSLPIVFQQGGNNARQGFRLLDGAAPVDHRDVPYVVLDLDADRLSLTLLHEGGHVVDRIIRAGRRVEPTWSALPHSTFAVTDPVTALAEGFAIHFETLWGHYGSTPERRAYYHRTDPAWSPAAGTTGEFIAPVRDLMNFSQNWARYQAVRDGLAVFEGHVYGGDYLRSQYDPARDRSRLRPASAMVASEGAVASILFWVAQGHARAAGAIELGGLEQPALLSAELQLVAALQRASAGGSGPVDIIDVVNAAGAPGSADHRMAVERFVAITKGVTSRPDIRGRWQDFYGAAIGLDIARARGIATEFETIRREVVAGALADPRTLRRAVGPVLAVRVDRAQVVLKALGKPFTVEMDLNALGLAELHVLSEDPRVRDRIRAALDQRPFASLDDFEQRTGTPLATLGAVRAQ